MCFLSGSGATDEQKDLETQQAQFYKEMSAQYATVFGEQQEILKTLNGSLSPMVQAGPNQRGFSDAERTDLLTKAKTNVAANFANAKKALQENLAARGGSDFLPSGADVQMEGGLEATAAAEESNLGQQVELDDFSQGRSNYWTAVNALGGNANMLNPTGVANSAISAGNSASDSADRIAAQDNSIWNTVLGGIFGIGGQYIGRPKQQGVSNPGSIPVGGPTGDPGSSVPA